MGFICPSSPSVLELGRPLTLDRYPIGTTSRITIPHASANSTLRLQTLHHEVPAVFRPYTPFNIRLVVRHLLPNARFIEPSNSRRLVTAGFSVPMTLGE